MVLDLSRKGQWHKGSSNSKSVNELTNKDAASNASMAQLGSTLGRIIFAVASRQGPNLVLQA